MQTNHEALTLDEVATALGFVPAFDRDVWVQMAMAVKSEFGEVGFDLWNNWSATADNYQPKAALATWRSVKPGGAVGIGTLIHAAKQNGFAFAATERTAEQKQAQQQEQAQRALQRAQAEREFAAWQSRWHERIAHVSRELFVEHIHRSGTSKYLGQKKVMAHGIGFVRHGFILAVDDVAETVSIITGAADIVAFTTAHTGANYQQFKNDGGWFIWCTKGTIAVPLRNAAGEICNIQFIFVDKKQFIKNGRKSGLFHMLGSIVPTTPALLIAEGYATAATLHEAAGLPVVMALDCGNLLSVAQSLRAANNTLPLLVCGDDDVATEGNPGRKFAEAAANAVAGVAVFPVFGNEEAA